MPDERPTPPDAATIPRARAFLLARWQERAVELGHPAPATLAGACKFASLFGQAVFGGVLRGHQAHQWLEIDGQVIELADPSGLPPGERAYVHDPNFWMNAEHRDALASCAPRVARWVDVWHATTAAPRVERRRGAR